MQDITDLSKDKHKKLIQQSAKYRIDRRKTMEYPTPIISMGEKHLGQNIYPIPFGTRGNFSAVQGGAKVGKTYFRSLLVASWIGGNAIEYAPNIKSHRTDNNLEVLEFDTEQAEWSSHNGATRVDKMVGAYYDNYYTYFLREIDVKDRVDFIEYQIYHKHKNVELVIIDGIADLVNDVNSMTEANEIIQKIMTWSSELNIHILIFIHTNYGSDKATGNLGSAIGKKAETVCDLKRDKEFTNIKFVYCRGFKPDDFKFSLDQGGYPRTEAIEEEY